MEDAADHPPIILIPVTINSHPVIIITITIALPTATTIIITIMSYSLSYYMNSFDEGEFLLACQRGWT